MEPEGQVDERHSCWRRIAVTGQDLADVEHESQRESVVRPSHPRVVALKLIHKGIVNLVR